MPDLEPFPGQEERMVGILSAEAPNEETSQLLMQDIIDAGYNFPFQRIADYRDFIDGVVAYKEQLQPIRFYIPGFRTIQRIVMSDHFIDHAVTAYQYQSAITAAEYMDSINPINYYTQRNLTSRLLLDDITHEMLSGIVEQN